MGLLEDLPSTIFDTLLQGKWGLQYITMLFKGKKILSLGKS
jgi:hypothetical protein